MKTDARLKSLLLKSKQAAELLAISRRKLTQLTSDEEIPFVRLGGCLRYPRDDLIEWIEENKSGGAAR